MSRTRAPKHVGCSVEGCKREHAALGYCGTHYSRLLRGKPIDAPLTRQVGVVCWRTHRRDGYITGTVNGAPTLQHRFVMETHLGRPLFEHETVHHKNGNRSDNRLDNLELWSGKQPAGQRVEDKLSFARDILATYEQEQIDAEAEAFANTVARAA